MFLIDQLNSYQPELIPSNIAPLYVCHILRLPPALFRGMECTNRKALHPETVRNYDLNNFDIDNESNLFSQE